MTAEPFRPNPFNLPDLPEIAMEPLPDVEIGQAMNLLARFSTPERPLDFDLFADEVVGPVVMRWLIAINAEFAGTETPHETLWGPFTGNPVPVINRQAMQEAAFTPRPHLAVVPPDVEVNVVAEPVVTPEAPETLKRKVMSADDGSGDKGRWVKQFVMVHRDVVLKYTPIQLLAVIVLRRVQTSQGDAYITPEREAARIGVTTRRLSEWLSPGGALYNEAQLVEVKFNDKGEERWKVELRPINLVWGVDKNGKKKKVLDTPADAFVKIQKCWIWDEVDGDQWVRKPVALEAIRGVALVRAASNGGDWCMKSVQYFALDFGGKSIGKVQAALNAAEDAGLITVAVRSGKRAGWRRWHKTPVAADKNTSGTRRPNEGRPPASREAPF